MTWNRRLFVSLTLMNSLVLVINDTKGNHLLVENVKRFKKE